MTQKLMNRIPKIRAVNRGRLPRSWVIGSLGILWLVACGEPPTPASRYEPSGQALALTPISRSNQEINPFYEGRSDPLLPTRFPIASPADWVALTPEEVAAELASNSIEGGYLATDAPATKKAQAILDEVFDNLVTMAPDRFVSKEKDFHIPRPMIRIRSSPIANASVVKLSVCRGGSIIFPNSASTNDADKSENKIVSLDHLGRVGVFSEANVHCINRRTSALSPEDLAHALNDDVSQPRCSWKASRDGLELGEGCKYDSKTVPTRANSILLTTTTNLFILTTGAMDLFHDEEELKYTIAHEMGHYLYAHGSLSKNKYVYFYHLNSRNYKHQKPHSDAALNSLGAKAAKLPTFRTQPVEGQKIHSEMFSYFREALKRIIKPICSNSDTPCFRPCEGLILLAKKSADFAEFHRFPQSVLDAKKLILYQQYESEFLKCTAAIPISDESSSANIGSVSVKEATKIYWNANPTGKQTLKDLAIEMNSRLAQKEATQNAVLSEAFEKRIGYYTTEEEADNLALEWSFSLGLTPEKIFTYWLEYMLAVRGQEQDSKLSFGYEHCASFFRTYSHQIYEDGGPLVPVGSYSNPHHSLCFRGFRTAQRLAWRYNIRLNPSFILDALSRIEAMSPKQAEPPSLNARKNLPFPGQAMSRGDF